MAEISQHEAIFGYRNVEILKGEENSLGIGSYGAVYKARCDDLPCAAKILHPTLFQSNDPGARRLLQKFEQECSFMNRIRHPNVVLFLGVWRDPQSNLPVLLMELLDENLTTFLERSQEPLPFDVQVNFCYDVALALSYLHSNNVIHRDLSSNNVLLVAGNQTVKITDFGMSKLIATTGMSRRFSRLSLTHCPGTEVYMPPEALNDDNPVYTSKLDCFSFGPLVIQIITRLFPNPGRRTNAVPFPQSPTGTTEVPILEPERRQSHIRLINPEHPLLPIAISCIEYKPENRPSAQEICQRIGVVRESPQYIDSIRNMQENTQRERFSDHERLLAEKDEELRMLAKEKEELARRLLERDEQLQEVQIENEREIISKDEQIQRMISLLQVKDRELQVALDMNPQAEVRVTEQRKQEEIVEKPKYPPSISASNVETAQRCWHVIQSKYHGERYPYYRGGERYPNYYSDACYTLTVPSQRLKKYPTKFQQTIFDYLYDKETQQILEAEHHLNWCSYVPPMVPLHMKQDGDSLCRAVALAIWGLDDRDHNLRRAIYYSLTQYEKYFKERFKAACINQCKIEKQEFKTQQFEEQWKATVDQASCSSSGCLQLEEFHIFVLSNILQRPIVVYTDCRNKVLQQINYHGIYLPIVFWEIYKTGGNCYRNNPIPLAYNDGHYHALTWTDFFAANQTSTLSGQEQINVSLPICDYYGRKFPVKYTLPSEEPETFLQFYVTIEQKPTPEIKNESPYFTTDTLTCAKLSFDPRYNPPQYIQTLLSEFLETCYIEYVSTHQQQGAHEAKK